MYELYVLHSGFVTTICFGDVLVISASASTSMPQNQRMESLYIYIFFSSYFRLDLLEKILLYTDTVSDVSIRIINTSPFLKMNFLRIVVFLGIYSILVGLSLTFSWRNRCVIHPLILEYLEGFSSPFPAQTWWRKTGELYTTRKPNNGYPK